MTFDSKKGVKFKDNKKTHTPDTEVGFVKKLIKQPLGHT